MNPAAIPAELRERDQWVLWRTVPREDGKPTKPPFQVRQPQIRASTTDSRTWSSFEAALAAAGQADGLGYVFSPEDPFVGVDLDEGLPENDRLLVVAALDSYAEVSPSGNGYHVIVKAHLNGRGRHPEGIGVFSSGRFFTVTGAHVRGTPAAIEERQEQLEEVLERFLPPAQESRPVLPPAPVELDDQEVLERAFAARNGERFRALWAGNTAGYASHSEADMALTSMLAFWTGRDPDRMDRLFRSSGLYRDKWDRDDYRTRTIEAAISACDEVFEPSARNVGGTANASKPLYIKEKWVPSDFPGGCELEAVLNVFGELLVLPDPGAVEVALAAVVANYASGDVVWPLFVGPPGCGKSELVNALTGAPGVWALSSLTPQTLLSGFERKNAKGPPASLLKQIGDFGILAFKDLTTVLTMHREARAQIIGQLREVADGKTEKSFGNGLRVEWAGKLGLVAGVTPIIDEQHAFLAVMGERFVLYRLPEVGRREIARRSLERRGRESELREQIRNVVTEFLGRFRNVGRLELDDRFTEPLITLADIVTRSRSGVARDYQTRDILYLPEPEAPTRLAKQIAQLTAAAIAIGVDEAEAWRLAQKVGWDSVPAVRTAVMRVLSRPGHGELTMADLQELTGLPETTIRRVVEDLVVLGLVDRRKESGKWLVSESELVRAYGMIP